MSDQTPSAGGGEPAAPKGSSVLSRIRAQQAATATTTSAPKPAAKVTAAEPAKPAAAKDAPHPSGDNRFKLLDTALKKQRYAADSLIEILHTAQEIFGYLKVDILHYVAHALKLPPSRVYGVATFYHFFTFKPKGDHTCVVCMGTACYVKGADAVQAAIQSFARERTEFGTISVETARCVGACGLAPVVVYDGDVVGNLVADTARERMEGWKRNGSQ